MMHEEEDSIYALGQPNFGIQDIIVSIARAPEKEDTLEGIIDLFKEEFVLAIDESQIYDLVSPVYDPMQTYEVLNSSDDEHDDIQSNWE